jgi:hypothetical protein
MFLRSYGEPLAHSPKRASASYEWKNKAGKINNLQEYAGGLSASRFRDRQDKISEQFAGFGDNPSPFRPDVELFHGGFEIVLRHRHDTLDQRSPRIRHQVQLIAELITMLMQDSRGIEDVSWFEAHVAMDQLL